MSHFAVVVLVEGDVTRENAADAVTPLLAPYDENGEWFAEGSRWDWWQVGGRWTGELDVVNYDPTEDPENFETCSLCGGTGRRPDAEQFGPEWIAWSNGCNGCRGKGWCVKWPTEWRPYENDVAPLKNSRPDFIPAAVVTPDGKWIEEGRHGWFGTVIEDEGGNDRKPEEVWAATVRALYDQYPEATAVIVDCHV